MFYLKFETKVLTGTVPLETTSRLRFPPGGQFLIKQLFVVPESNKTKPVTIRTVLSVK